MRSCCEQQRHSDSWREHCGVCVGTAEGGTREREAVHATHKGLNASLFSAVVVVVVCVS